MTQQTIDTTASPIVPQTMGLAAFELQVSATPLIITFDVDALNAAVDAVLENYDDLNIEEDDIPAIKSEMAGLNKIKERIESARKDIAGKISAPVTKFESQVKAVTKRIVEVRAKLDAQVKSFEERQRQARSASVLAIIDDVLQSADIANFIVPIDARWLNKSASKKDIHAAVESIVLKEKARRLETERFERAKQDRVSWLEQSVRIAEERYKFSLPLSRFSSFLSLDTTTEEAQKAIGIAFEEEHARRNNAPVPAMAAPAPIPAPYIDDGDDAMPMATHNANNTGGACPRRIMYLQISYAPQSFFSINRLLDELRNIAIVTVQNNTFD